MIGFSASATINTQDVVRRATAALKPTVLEAAALVEGEAKTQVPVDTGRLQESIHIEETAEGPYFYEVSVHPAELAANDWGFDPAYARRIEYGFVGKDRLGRNYHQTAQPYMRPAADIQGAAVIDTLARGIALGIGGA